MKLGVFIGIWGLALIGFGKFVFSLSTPITWLEVCGLIIPPLGAVLGWIQIIGG